MALSAGDFKKEFLDQLLEFSKKNPPTMIEEEKRFVWGFYDRAYQEMAGKDEVLRLLYITAQ